jgi:hypothetical protein
MKRDLWCLVLGAITLVLVSSLGVHFVLGALR